MNERVSERFRLGIDLGGTKTEAVLLDSSGAVVWRARVTTPAHDYAAIIGTIQSLSKQAESFAGESLAVGIGTPGALSPRSGLLRNSNTLCMNGKNLLKDLQDSLQKPLRIQNDANCFALSEAMDGAAADYALVFGVIIGTGTGGGLVWNKKLLTGRHAIGGEWGHNPLPWSQPFDIPAPCYCGQRGCIETFLSGPGFIRNVKSLTGKTFSSEQIVAAAARGDALCRQQMEHYFDQLARALAQVINIIDPDAIVLGGGMSNIQAIYDEVPARLERYVFSDYVDTALLAPKFGDSSGVRGAAWLWG